MRPPAGRTPRCSGRRSPRTSAWTCPESAASATGRRIRPRPPGRRARSGCRSSLLLAAADVADEEGDAVLLAVLEELDRLAERVDRRLGAFEGGHERERQRAGVRDLPAPAVG